MDYKTIGKHSLAGSKRAQQIHKAKARMRNIRAHAEKYGIDKPEVLTALGKAVDVLCNSLLHKKGSMEGIRKFNRIPLSNHLEAIGCNPNKYKPRKNTIWGKTFDDLADTFYARQKTVLLWRMLEEYDWQHKLTGKQPWPIFLHVTIKPSSYNSLTGEEGTKIVSAFFNNIRRNYQQQMKALGKCQKTYRMAFIKVAEHGNKSGRLHFHSIIITPYRPEILRQPQSHLDQHMYGYEKYWEHGKLLTTPIRITRFDAWGTVNTPWPSKKLPTGQTIPRTEEPIEKALSYPLKYISKHIGELKWRTGITRSLGLSQLQLLMTNLPKSLMIDALQSRQPLKIRINGRTIPTTILKETMKRELGKRMTSSQSMKNMKEYSPQDSIVKQMQELITAKSTTLNSESITTLRTLITEYMDGSNKNLITWYTILGACIRLLEANPNTNIQEQIRSYLEH